MVEIDLLQYEDGVPQTTKITLKFKEMEIITKKAIASGSLKMYFAQFPLNVYDSVGDENYKVVTHLLKRVADSC